MATRAQRFAVRNAAGARSSEWVVMWKTNASDVYLATRTLGGSMKASLHGSGRGHVRAPDPRRWRGQGQPPRFLDEWQVDINARYQLPFSVVVCEQELRIAEWASHRDKGTIWIEVARGRAVEVGIHLLRAQGDQSPALTAAGWHTTLVDTPLYDGRRLIVAAGETNAPPLPKLEELAQAKLAAQSILSSGTSPTRNPRLILAAGPNERGTRMFVEAAALP